MHCDAMEALRDQAASVHSVSHFVDHFSLDSIGFVPRKIPESSFPERQQNKRILNNGGEHSILVVDGSICLPTVLWFAQNE